MNVPSPPIPGCAVLASGGLISSVLLHRMTSEFDRVVPIYVRCGFHWEEEEVRSLHAFLEADPDDRIETPVILESPMADLLGSHWSITGKGIPGDETPDDAAQIPGRNMTLLSKAIVYASLQRFEAIAFGLVRGDTSPDASLEFLSTIQGLSNFLIGPTIKILTPYSQVRKVQVIRKGRDLPLGLTLSCLDPVEGGHCERCNKCYERQVALRKASYEENPATPE